MARNTLTFENNDELANKIENQIITFKANMKEKNISIFGEIRINVLGIPMTYDTEKRTIVSNNELGFVEISKTSTYTESKSYLCITPFSDKNEEKKKIEYIKQFTEINGILYQNDIVKFASKELNKLLLKDGFTEDEDGFYKIYQKDIEDGDILDNISSEFKKTKSYEYLSRTMNEESITENTLGKLKEFDILKLVVLTTYKKMLKTFLRRSKTKGFYRKNKTKSNH